MHELCWSPGRPEEVHLARQLYALPPMVQFLKDAKGVPIPWDPFTHFSAPLLVRRRQAIPYCGDLVILGHAVQGATFLFKCPPGPEEPLQLRSQPQILYICQLLVNSMSRAFNLHLLLHAVVATPCA